MPRYVPQGARIPCYCNEACTKQAVFGAVYQLMLQSSITALPASRAGIYTPAYLAGGHLSHALGQ